MSNYNELYWMNERIKTLKKEYFLFIAERGLENTFDNCNEYLSLSYGTNLQNREFGVATRAELAKSISGDEPNIYSL